MGIGRPGFGPGFGGGGLMFDVFEMAIIRRRCAVPTLQAAGAGLHLSLHAMPSAGLPARRPACADRCRARLHCHCCSNDAIAVAAGKAMEARSLLPGLPQIDTRVLEAAKMGACCFCFFSFFLFIYHALHCRACTRCAAGEGPWIFRRSHQQRCCRSPAPHSPCRHLPEHPVWRPGQRYDRNDDGALPGAGRDSPSVSWQCQSSQRAPSPAGRPRGPCPSASSAAAPLAQIQKSMRDVQTMVQQVGDARTWAQSNLAVYQHKDSEAKAAVGWSEQ